MPLRFTPTNVFQQYIGATIVVYHDVLGELIGRIIQVNNTSNKDLDWIKIEYYKPDNTIAISQFSPKDLSAPQYYTGPLPPYQPWPQPGRPRPGRPQPGRPQPWPQPRRPQPWPQPGRPQPGRPQPGRPQPNIPWWFWWFLRQK